jgi:antitoxin VapB
MHKKRLPRPIKTAKVFKSGNSQAVRIPKEFHIEADEVEIRRKGSALILRPMKKSWRTLIDSLSKFSDDFMQEGRQQPRAEQRRRAF